MWFCQNFKCVLSLVEIKHIKREHIYVLTLCLSISFFMSQLFYSHRHTCKVKFCTALKLIVKWIMDELTNRWTDVIHGQYFKEMGWDQCSHTYCDSLDIHWKHCDNCSGQNKAVTDHLVQFSINKVFLQIKAAISVRTTFTKASMAIQNQMVSFQQNL